MLPSSLNTPIDKILTTKQAMTEKSPITTTETQSPPWAVSSHFLQLDAMNVTHIQSTHPALASWTLFRLASIIQMLNKQTLISEAYQKFKISLAQVTALV
jgi:hypothetical protein